MSWEEHKIDIRSRYMLIYVTMTAITTTILILLNELRVDVYLSLYILEYYILRAIISPASAETSLSYLKIIDYIFLIIFILIVAYRVIEILFPEYLWWLSW